MQRCYGLANNVSRPLFGLGLIVVGLGLDLGLIVVGLGLDLGLTVVGLGLDLGLVQFWSVLCELVSWSLIDHWLRNAKQVI